MYLPMHMVIPKGDTDADTAKTTAARAKLPKEFQMVNFSRVRAVAFMAVEAQSRMQATEITPQTVQWVQHYGGNPQTALARIDQIMADNNETKKIKSQQLYHFVSNSAFWGPHVDALVNHLSS